jgi:hypothetical protein
VNGAEVSGEFHHSCHESSGAPVGEQRGFLFSQIADRAQPLAGRLFVCWGYGARAARRQGLNSVAKILVQ